MTPWRLDLSVVADMAANVFAVCLLILVVLLAQKRHPPGAPARIEATTDLHLVERSPLPAGDRIELLHARRAAPSGLTFDLFEDRVEVFVPGAEAPAVLAPRRGTPGIGEAAAGLLRTLPRGAPLRLFVFSNRWYAPVTGAMMREGRAWGEVSVPAALRAPSRPDGAWSQGFQALEAERPERARFRQGLARLLDGSDGARTGERRAAARQAAPAPAPLAGRLLGGLRRFLRALAPFAALAVPVLIVLAAERRFPPLHARRPFPAEGG